MFTAHVVVPTGEGDAALRKLIATSAQRTVIPFCVLKLQLVIRTDEGLKALRYRRETFNGRWKSVR
jgi:hypothetical protein